MSKTPKRTNLNALLLGDPDVGKSTLLDSYLGKPDKQLEGKRHSTLECQDAAFNIRLYEINNIDRCEQLVKESTCVFLLFNTGNRDSFENLYKWFNTLTKADCYFMIVANYTGEKDSYADKKDIVEEAETMIKNFKLESGLVVMNCRDEKEVALKFKGCLQESIEKNRARRGDKEEKGICKICAIF